MSKGVARTDFSRQTCLPIRDWNPSILVVFVCLLLLTASCGRKGNPTLTSFEKPAAVTDVRAVHREDEIIILWSYPSSDRQGIKGYYVEKATDAPLFTAPPVAFLNSSVTRFADKDFKPKAQYFYRVRAYSLRDVLGEESPVLKVVPENLPAFATGLAYKTAIDSVEISWTAGKQAQAENQLYNVYRTFQKGTVPATPINKVPLKETFFKDKIDTQRAVYYTVRALLDTQVRDEGSPSAELEINPGSYVPSKAGGLRYVSSENKVYLIWNENPENWVKGYRIYRKRATEAEFRQIGEVVTPAFSDQELPEIKTLYYVKAVGPLTEGASSEVIEAGPLTER